MEKYFLSACRNSSRHRQYPVFLNCRNIFTFSAGIGFLSQLKEVPESVFLQETVDENQLVHVYSVFEVISTLAFQFSSFDEFYDRVFRDSDSFLFGNDRYTLRSSLDIL